MHKNKIIPILAITFGCLLLSCGQNTITNSAATRWLGSYSGSGELKLWHPANDIIAEPYTSTSPNQNVTIDIQEGTGIDAFLSGIKLIVTYSQDLNTLTSISFPSQRSGPSTASNLSNHLRLSADTLQSTTHDESLTYNLTLFKQGEGFAGHIKSTEIQTNENQDSPVVWSLDFTITTKD